MEQIFTALDSKQLAGGMFLDVTKKRHLIPLIILPYVINWLPMVHRLKLSHGSNQSSANWKWFLETLILPFPIFHRPVLLAPSVNDLPAARPHKGWPWWGCTPLEVPLSMSNDLLGIKHTSLRSASDSQTGTWSKSDTSFAGLHYLHPQFFLNLPLPLPQVCGVSKLSWAEQTSCPLRTVLLPGFFRLRWAVLPCGDEMFPICLKTTDFSQWGRRGGQRRVLRV